MTIISNVMIERRARFKRNVTVAAILMAAALFLRAVADLIG